MSARTQELPRFVKDLLSLPPRRGGGLNLWIFKVARYLHGYRDPSEIIALLKAVTFGEPIKHGEIERAVANSAAVAWRPGETSTLKRKAAWPKVNQEQREAVILQHVLAHTGVGSWQSYNSSFLLP